MRQHAGFCMKCLLLQATDTIAKVSPHLPTIRLWGARERSNHGGRSLPSHHDALTMMTGTPASPSPRHVDPVDQDQLKSNGSIEA